METRKMKLPAGWYPKSKIETEEAIENFLSGFNPPSIINPLGGLVPHAGWYFSGKLSCRIISVLAEAKPDTILLFGGHLGNDKPRLFVDNAFETPLGEIESDQEIIEEIRSYCTEEPALESDNTVEIQLPFIKHFLPETKICALRSPSTNDAIKIGEKCAQAAEKLGKKIVMLGSLDLTHYGPRYGFAPKGIGGDSIQWVKNKNDKEIVDFMSKLDAKKTVEHAVKNHSSCSPGAAASVIAGVNTLLSSPVSMILDYYTSADIMPDDNFVGYVGMLYYEK